MSYIEFGTYFYIFLFLSLTVSQKIHLSLNNE